MNQKSLEAPFAGVIGIPQVEVGQYVDARHRLRDAAGSRQHAGRLLRSRAADPAGRDRHAGHGRHRGRRHDAYRPDHRDRTEGSTPTAASSRSAPRSTIPTDGASTRASSCACASSCRRRPDVIALPQTVLSSTLYGDSVFVVRTEGEGDAAEADGRAGLRQGRPPRARPRRDRRGPAGRRRRGRPPGRTGCRSGAPVIDRQHASTRRRRADAPAARRRPMNFSEIFIRRPVLSTVVAAFILLLGLPGHLQPAPSAQYPEVEETVITITTVYPGASADLIQGFITAPIAAAVATDGERRLRHLAEPPSASVVSVHMRLGVQPRRGADRGPVEGPAGARPAAERRRRPDHRQGHRACSSRSCTSRLQNPNMTPEQMTEYLERVIQPRMSTIDGVAEVQIIGARELRDARLDRSGPARRARASPRPRCSPAISASNFLSAPGKTENEFVAYAITDADRRCRRRRPSAQLPLTADGDEVVRLRDVATIELAREEHRHRRHLQRQPGTFIGVFPTPAANPLDTAVGGDRRTAGDPARAAAGHGRSTLVYDSTESISASIERGVQDDRRSGGHRRRRHPPLPRLVPLGADADRHHPAVADRRLLRPLAARLFDQPADAARDGARDRPRRRRRHRRGREHPPPHRGGRCRRCDAAIHGMREISGAGRRDDASRSPRCSRRSPSPAA